MKTYALKMTLLAFALVLAGCQSILQRQVDATPAPTAVPLATNTPTSQVTTPTPSAAPATAFPTDTPPPTASPTPSTTRAAASPTNTPAPTATPTPAATTSDTSPTANETRVVAPAETIGLPSGFGISVFAAGLNGPRMMAVGPDGALYVAERGAGRIVRLPDRDGDGIADDVEPVIQGLDTPSSIAFYKDGSLYIGETTRVLKLDAPTAGEGPGKFQVVIEGLPPRRGHSTRTVLFGPDWQWLFVSVGSSCNVCVEQDPRRATIVRYSPDGEDETILATGLRNAVGITFRPGADELWATNNGRDGLGDDQPPETIYLVREGDDAGWPRCHAGRIVDPEFGQEGSCEGVTAPVVEMQAHSAPLGLAFYTGRQFPAEYNGDLFVAFHGSWNRSVPTGYKVVHIAIENGVPGAVADFAVGWLSENGSNWGRPVDVVTGAEGSLFVSDDGQGNIYRIFYTGE